MIESAKTPEEALWRAVLLRFSGDVFKLKVEMDQAHNKLKSTKDKNKLIQYRSIFERYAFNMQKYKNELEPSLVGKVEVLPIRDICDYANVPFETFKSRMFNIIDGVLDVPNTGKKYMFNN